MKRSTENWTELGDYLVGPRLDRHGDATRQHFAKNSEGERMVVRIFDGERTGNRYVNEGTYQFQRPTLHTATDVVQADGIRFIARPYVDGVDLRAIAAAPASETKTAAACRILLDLAQAVEWLTEYRHEIQGVHGLSHRALEARSILVSTAGETRIINFDRMKAHRDASSLQDATIVPVLLPGPTTTSVPRPSDTRAVFQLALEIFRGDLPERLPQEESLADGMELPTTLRDLLEGREGGRTLENLLRMLDELVYSDDLDLSREAIGGFVASLDGYVSRT